MTKGGGSASGSLRAVDKVSTKANAKASARPSVGTPGREEARDVQWDLPTSREAWLMAQQDQAMALPGTTPAQRPAPARVMSTNWVEQDQEAKLAQAVRSANGLPTPAPGGTTMQTAPTYSEKQAIEAMRARLAKSWGLPSEPTYDTGVETRVGYLRAWAAELPGKAKGREEEREP